MNLNQQQEQRQKMQLVAQLKYEKSQLERRIEATEQGIGALAGLEWTVCYDGETHAAIQAICAVQLSQLRLALVEGQERMSQINGALEKLTSNITTATLVTPATGILSK